MIETSYHEFMIKINQLKLKVKIICLDFTIKTTRDESTWTESQYKFIQTKDRI